MVLNISKKLIWILLIITLILLVVLIILNFLYASDQKNLSSLWGEIEEEGYYQAISHWIVFPEKDYSGMTMVVMEGSKTLARETYQPLKLVDGYEAIITTDLTAGDSLTSRFAIYDLPYSDRNELSSEALNKYLVDKPFKEIYYCGNTPELLTEEKANQLITEKTLATYCQQINGFLF